MDNYNDYLTRVNFFKTICNMEYADKATDTFYCFIVHQIENGQRIKAMQQVHNMFLGTLEMAQTVVNIYRLKYKIQ